MEQLQTSVEEEEEAKQMLQNKMLQLTQQVYFNVMVFFTLCLDMVCVTVVCVFYS